MPKRSNEFQKLIKLLETQLGDEDIEIEESKLLTDKRNGQSREIDIFIKSQISDHPISIAIECRDQKRKAGSPWIDELTGRFSALDVDKVIAVSKSGFSEPAIKAAKHSNIELITLEKAIKENWLKSVKNPWNINFTVVRFKPIRTEYGLSKGLFEEAREEIKVFDYKDEYRGTLNEFSQKLTHEPIFRKEFFKSLKTNFDPKKKQFIDGDKVAVVSWKPTKKYTLRDDYKFECKLEKVKYTFAGIVKEISIPTKRFTYNNAQVATTTKELLGMKLIVSLAEKEDMNPTFSILAEIELPDGDNYTYELVSKPLSVNNLSLDLIGFVLG